MAFRKRDKDDNVVRITGAPENLGTDIAHRQKRYLVSMIIRTLCFVGAVLSYKIPVLCWTLIAAAFILPFIAVVIANKAAPRVGQSLEGPGVGHRSPFGELGPGDHNR